MRQAVAGQQGDILAPSADRTLESVAAASSAALVTIDATGTVILWNAAAERMFGWSAADVLGRHIPLMAPAAAKLLAAEVASPAAGFDSTIREPEPVARRLGCRRHDGSDVEASLVALAIRDEGGRAIGTTLLLSPAPPRPSATGAVAAAGAAGQGEAATNVGGPYRLEALSRFAAGVAHDVNNVLAAIIGHADVLATDLPADASAQAAVGEIRSATDRAARLMRQLLTFGRRQPLAPEPLDIDEVITGIEDMLRGLAGRAVSLIVMRSASSVIVDADREQLEQVLANLVVNARDAMPEGGELQIATAPVDLDEAFVARHAGSKPGSYVRIVVRDSGIGMDETTLAHLFEPYYTTRPAGKGTGLGLAMVYGAVKQANGYIVAQSTLGVGTTMTIYLPRR
ncbi:MAG: PAS domain S-box protein [Chloroflexi bacterium]|nr:PAS domain S-box protein [Chloroflexota bacterium]